MNKKADGGLTAIIIVVIIIVFLGWLVNIGDRECNKNSDCSDESYCGVDHNCHKVPIIEKEPIIVERNYVAPAIIIGIAMIITAVILKLDKIIPKKQKQTEIQKTLEPDYEYYTNFPPSKTY